MYVRGTRRPAFPKRAWLVVVQGLRASGLGSEKLTLLAPLYLSVEVVGCTP